VKLNLKFFISDNTDLWLTDAGAVPTNALDDVKVLNTTNPPSLTSSFTIFEKADLIQRHRSRFSRQ
jgi:hypothetical protein